jgi:hypothetical protein
LVIASHGLAEDVAGVHHRDLELPEGVIGVEHSLLRGWIEARYVDRWPVVEGLCSVTVISLPGSIAGGV